MNNIRFFDAIGWSKVYERKLNNIDIKQYLNIYYKNVIMINNKELKEIKIYNYEKFNEYLKKIFDVIISYDAIDYLIAKTDEGYVDLFITKDSYIFYYKNKKRNINREYKINCVNKYAMEFVTNIEEIVEDICTIEEKYNC